MESENKTNTQVYMHIRKSSILIRKIPVVFLLCLLLFPITLRASFIEATMGAAVVNDATATFYNPASLVFLKNPQIILLNSISSFNSQFTGQAIQAATGFTESGSSSTKTHYYLPSFYLGMPVTNNITIGLAVISNFFNNDLDGNSILRYVQSSNTIQSVDFVPALEYKFNDFFSVGASINLSYASFLLIPTSGFPSLNIPDSQSRNESKGNGLGGDIGFLLKPNKSTTIGFNYRSAITYRLNGTSVLESNPEVISNHYGFTFWTPARSTLSINQLITSKFGMISTIQRIQWSIFKEIDIHGIATQIGSQPVILDATVPYHLHDTWLLTVGAYHHITSKWTLRIAGSYNQSPANGHFQISNSNSIIVGGSVGYKISKNIIIDGGYAHAFIQNKNINITGGINQIDGRTNGSVDAFSLKLTLNI
jgi:long-subunit fatty acid transport protein